MKQLRLQISYYPQDDSIWFSEEVIVKRWSDIHNNSIKIVRVTERYIETDLWYKGKVPKHDIVWL